MITEEQVKSIIEQIKALPKSWPAEQGNPYVVLWNRLAEEMPEAAEYVIQCDYYRQSLLKEASNEVDFDKLLKIALENLQWQTAPYNLSVLYVELRTMDRLIANQEDAVAELEKEIQELRGAIRMLDARTVGLLKC